MILYDGFISQIKNMNGIEDGKIKPYSVPKIESSEKNTVLFSKDTAFELGGSQKKCVSTLLVSSDIKFENKVTLVGPDISDIKTDSPFAKVLFLEIDDVNEEIAFEKIKELEHFRYRYSVEGFMSRASALSMREQIRVSKNTVKKGVSFFDYGNSVVSRYLEHPLVKSAEILIVTAENFDYGYLTEIAEKIKNTTSALNHILDNVLFDCKSCNLKEICDEVEGMKELHIKQMKNPQ